MPLRLPGTEADQRRAGSITQADVYGYLSMNFDPAATLSNSSPLTPAGTLWTVKMPVRQPIRVTNIVLWVTTAGATLTASQCKAALYQGGALVGTTADQSATWNSTGLKTMALASGPFWVGPQSIVDVAFWYQGTTGPAFLRGASQSSVYLGQVNPDQRTATTSNTGLTTAAPASLGTKTGNSTLYWAALS